MIRMTILSGPYAGQTRTIPADVKPQNLFGELVERGWEWDVDYTQATAEEHWDWAKHDLMARIVRTLSSGKTVKFQNSDFFGIESAQAVEDAVVGSKRMVSWREHGWGLEIIVGGWEQ
jgi:hypothetical protein